ncbi:retrotransposon protein, putative, ty1-copia subclass [Tanacetum coccineum]
MTPELHRKFENSSPYDMIKELKAMFEKQAGVERFYLIQTFHACKQEEGKPVAAYVIQMKGYVDQLERLGYMKPQDLVVGLILNGLTKDFARFVRNYNTHNMGTSQVMMIKGGKIQKANKKSLKAKGKGKANGKGKDKQVYIPKPKNPKPSAKEHPAKDDACHHCKEVGHWKRNCPVYLAELLKKKKQVGSASSSGIFTIELFAFPNKSWVYDTGCGTNICITKQGFREARKLKQGALYLYVGNGVRAQVEAIGSFDLVLPNGLVICLDNCHYAPSILRGVVSVHRLVENGFVQRFTDFGISVSKNNVHYFNAIPSNGIYEIDMHNLVPNVNSIYNVSTKRAKHNLDSTYLWHCRLAHISKKRIEKLQQRLLKSIDDESFDQCVSCLSESATRILNMVPTKKVDKTPYELWYGKVPNLSYLKVWGCEALMKRDTTDKLQQRSVKCIFIGYPKETMGYYFYFPLENKIVVARSNRLIRLGQNAYMDKILKRYRMDNSKRGHIPMQERLDLNKIQGASTPKEVKRMQNVPYASAVGSIMYAVRCNRPNVAFA